MLFLYCRVPLPMVLPLWSKISFSIPINMEVYPYSLMYSSLLYSPCNYYKVKNIYFSLRFCNIDTIIYIYYINNMIVRKELFYTIVHLEKGIKYRE